MAFTEQLSRVSDLMCIWYHDKNISVEVLRQIKIYLHKYFNCSRIFDNMEDLTTYLADKLVIKRIVFIITIHDQTEATAIERLVKRRGQFQGLYRLEVECHASSILPDLALTRSIIKKLSDNINDDLRQTEQSHTIEANITKEVKSVFDKSPPSFDTFKSISTQSSLCDLSKESLKFLLLQSFVEILIRKSYDPDAFIHMWNLCYRDYIEDPNEAKKIQKIAEDYEREKAIYYYTQCSCLFRLINRAFRLEDIERIFRFGCYIADVYQQLEHLANNQRQNQNRNTKKMFYRGKRFSTDVVQQFKDNIGHFISLNGLLSTSENYVISTVFSGLDGKNDDYQSVIFEFNINYTGTNPIRPYANIREFSAKPDENEVLFFMGFVWKLESMKEISSNAWYIVLQSCTDYDTELIKYIEKSRRDCTYLTIGNILRELGDYANATNFYQRMLKEKNLSDEIRGDLYFNMAILAEDQGAYLEALEYLEKAEKLIKTTETYSSETWASSRSLFAHDIVPSRVHILNNLGRIYLKDGEYRSAQECFEAALQEPGSEVERATVLNNYGLLEFQRRNITKARDYIHQAVQLARNDVCSSEFKHNLDIIRKHGDT